MPNVLNNKMNMWNNLYILWLEMISFLISPSNKKLLIAQAIKGWLNFRNTYKIFQIWYKNCKICHQIRVLFHSP